MKTLKFMLAAATAIGISSAAQAVQNKEASTGFEKLAIGDKVPTGVYDNDANKSYFYYAGETAEDNESEIVAFVDNDVAVARPTGVSLFSGADATARANALQVSTGTDPLLRTFKQLSNGAPQAGETFTATTYIDTLVQFTVTPSNDTVTAGTDDKLMIYLREVAPVFGEDGSVTTKGTTNLVVKAGYLKSDFTVEAKEFALNADVKPGTWYRLTVEAIPGVLGSLASGSIGGVPIPTPISITFLKLSFTVKPCPRGANISISVPSLACEIFFVPSPFTINTILRVPALLSIPHMEIGRLSV